MALGGVPAGSMKSHEAPIIDAESSGSDRGSTLSATVMVAVFDATAESVTVANVARPICGRGDMPAIIAIWPAIQRERPLLSMPEAITKLPPSSTSVLHGRRRSDASETERVSARARAALIATQAS